MPRHKQPKQVGDGIMPRYNPSTFELDMARETVRQKQRVHNLMLNKYLELVTRMAEVRRQGYLIFRVDADNGLALELWEKDAATFVIYDFQPVAKIKEGLKLIGGYIERGDPITVRVLDHKQDDSTNESH